MLRYMLSAVALITLYPVSIPVCQAQIEEVLKTGTAFVVLSEELHPAVRRKDVITAGDVAGDLSNVSIDLTVARSERSISYQGTLLKFSQCVVPLNGWLEIQRMVGKPLWRRVDTRYFPALPTTTNLAKFHVYAVELGEEGSVLGVRYLSSDKGPFKLLVKTLNGKTGCYYGGPRQMKVEWHTENPIPLVSPEYLDAVKDYRVVNGMSGFEVELAWGRPDKINHTDLASGRHQQWVYRSDNRCVYLEDDVVTGIQY